MLEKRTARVEPSPYKHPSLRAARATSLCQRQNFTVSATSLVHSTNFTARSAIISRQSRISSERCEDFIQLVGFIPLKTDLIAHKMCFVLSHRRWIYLHTKCAVVRFAHAISYCKQYGDIALLDARQRYICYCKCDIFSHGENVLEAHAHYSPDKVGFHPLKTDFIVACNDLSHRRWIYLHTKCATPVHPYLSTPLSSDMG